MIIVKRMLRKIRTIMSEATPLKTRSLYVIAIMMISTEENVGPGVWIIDNPQFVLRLLSS